jgi:hypothetical protein
MTTLTIQLEEQLMERTRAIADSRHSSIDAVIADALTQMKTSPDPASGFLTLLDDLAAKDFSMPILSREERNARR